MLGRPCLTCSHPDRHDIEAAIAHGQPFRGIARQFGLSPDSVERHTARHLPLNCVRTDFRGERGLSAEELHTRMLAIADSARAVRLTDGLSVQDALRAGDAELRALSTIAGRLGTDAGTLAAELDSERAQRLEAEDAYAALGRAVAMLIRKEPPVRAFLIEILEKDAGDTSASASIASDLRRIHLLEVTT